MFTAFVHAVLTQSTWRATSVKLCLELRRHLTITPVFTSTRASAVFTRATFVPSLTTLLTGELAEVSPHDVLEATIVCNFHTNYWLILPHLTVRMSIGAKQIILAPLEGTASIPGEFMFLCRSAISPFSSKGIISGYRS